MFDAEASSDAVDAVSQARRMEFGDLGVIVGLGFGLIVDVRFVKFSSVGTSILCASVDTDLA